MQRGYQHNIDILFAPTRTDFRIGLLREVKSTPLSPRQQLQDCQHLNYLQAYPIHQSLYCLTQQYQIRL